MEPGMRNNIKKWVLLGLHCAVETVVIPCYTSRKS
ncbi:hypothetical protein AALP_AAs68231U000200 [Arabis alpina]|uniref:Uncharacterized protein n=1 Tax=Arabis alpina TaxID=50452 RepID=A0A087G2G0_ARAAL|nr:hypothetical protein AALP_AAs68231U000200 [Arabis alpina]